MRTFVIYIILSLLISSTNAQSPINSSLKNELDSMFLLDQKYRKVLTIITASKEDSLATVYGVKKEDLTNHLWKLQTAVDSTNTIRVEEIIKTHGYPGVSLVGSPTNEAAFYIIQHSKVIDKYLPIIKEAAEKKELRFQLYAMMLDRYLMFQDKEQVYGSQGTGFDIKNPATGNWERLSIIWPIKDPVTVNERRKAAGFTQTVEENAKQLGIEYKEYKLEEVLRMRAAITDGGR